MNLISIIVPIYKVEKYLDKCIADLVNQTYRNLEIILVDDGSPDRCPQICDIWAARDSRIKVIHQKNTGSGAARNRGLEIAKGDFIGFVDSDDYISPLMYEALLTSFDDNIDIVECDIILTTDDNAKVGTNGTWFKKEVYSAEEALALHIQDKLFCQTPPNKLYRKRIIKDILFPVGEKIDDEHWTYRVIGRARNLVHIYAPLYAYRQQNESIMHRAFSLERLGALNAKYQRLKYLEQFYPMLTGIAKLDLWRTFLYLGQMSQLYLSANDCKKAMSLICSMKNKIDINEVTAECLSIKEIIWLYLSNLMFESVCRIRNFLKIGL